MPENSSVTTVAHALAGHPDGLTARELAEATGLRASTVHKALTTLEASTAARRTAGKPNGRRKTADLWHPTIPTTDTIPTPDTDTTPDDGPAPDDGLLPDADPAPHAEATATDSRTAPADPPDHDQPDHDQPDHDQPDHDQPDHDPPDHDQPDHDQPDHDQPDHGQPDHGQDSAAGTEASQATTEPADSAPDTEATSEPDNSATATGSGRTPAADGDPAAAPAADLPRQPDLKVQIMASVLADHPDGLPAAEAITASGLAAATGDTILAAMELAGAARRLPITDDGVELWVRGEADLASVDPAHAPTHVTCPTCGHTRRIRRPSARRTHPDGDHNGNGPARLAKNGLRHQVEAFLRSLGAGHDLTPGTVARELGGRSSGAVGNAMARLTATGVLTITNEAPVMYALATNPPAPSPEVAALMATPLVTDTEPDAALTSAE